MQYRNFVLLVVLSLSVFLGGCAKPVVDLSDSIYSSDTIAKTTNSKMAKLTIENTAKSTKRPKFSWHLSEALFGDIHQPIAMQPILTATIEEDIRRFFEERLTYDTNSAIEVLVKIEEANSYWNWPAGERHLSSVGSHIALNVDPMLGIAISGNTAGNTRDIGMNLKFSISLIIDGEEFAHYLYDTPIIIQGKSSTKEKLVISYKELVSTYRNEVFSKLDAEVIEKYFSN